MKAVDKKEFLKLASEAYDRKEWKSTQFVYYFRENGHLYVGDTLEDKYWIDEDEELQTLYYNIKNLEKLYLREGFVDKSMNTDIYSPLNKFPMMFEGLIFTFKELTEILKQ